MEYDNFINCCEKLSKESLPDKGSLIGKKIDKKLFDNWFGRIISENEYMIFLGRSINERKKDIFSLVLMTGYQLGFININSLYLLNKVLPEDWHMEHEDIARTMQDLHDESSIEALCRTVYSKYKYLEYNDSQALARKCIYALGEIGSKKAIQILKDMCNSDDEYLRSTAKHQLEKRKFV
jgi:hypothetical protein